MSPTATGRNMLAPLIDGFSSFTPATYAILISLTVFALVNLKALPLVWSLRLFTFVLQSRSWLRPKHQLTHIFQPLIQHTRCALFECDYYMHKNNATFFADLDIARWHLFGTLLLPIILAPPPALTGSKDSGRSKLLAVVLGGVACSFKREIKPCERYEVWTRVLSWDDKWAYFVSHFVKAGKVRRTGWSLQPWKKTVAVERGQVGDVPPEKAILASAVSKLIFRYGRETISPDAVFRAAGLLPDENMSSGEASVWDAAKVEAERLKGMKLAEMMTGLNMAHEAFEPEAGPVLAEYRDVWAWA